MVLAPPGGKAIISKGLHQQLSSLFHPISASLLTLALPSNLCDRDYEFLFTLHITINTTPKFS